MDLTGAEEAELVAELRAGGSVFAEEELAELLGHARAATLPAGWERIDLLDRLVERRVDGEPIEHIVESAQFGELRVAVHHRVFVPRRRTVLLATVVAERLREVADARAGAGGAARAPRLLDFGCGSGAIAALAAHRVPGIEVVAIDADEGAVDCARVNLPGALVVHASTIDALAASQADAPGRTPASALFDVIAANLPYVPTEQLALLPHGTLDSEPRLALDGGDDGLDPLGEHAHSMAAWLLDGGIAVTEVAPHQVDRAIEIFALSGFASIEVRSDDELGATVVVATR